MQRTNALLTPEPLVGDHDHAVRDAAAVVVVGYVALVAVMILIGLTLTHVFERSVGGWDESVNRWFAGHRTATWNRLTGDATWLVNTVPAVACAALVTGVLLCFRRMREAVMLVLALALELLVFLTVNVVVGRPRPDVVRLDSTPSTSSFPSGHTAAATVLTAGLVIIVLCCSPRVLTRVLTAVLAVVATTAVGFGRVYRGLHHPTDVIAGALIGACCLTIAILAIRVWARRADAVRTADETDEQPARPVAA